MVLVDFGSKKNIICRLQERKCEIVVVSPFSTAEDIMGLNPDGLLLSNGPGDPVNVPYAVETVKNS